MNTLLVIINVIIMLLLIGVLYYMQRKHHSFNKRVFTAPGLGIIFGLILQLVYKPTSEVIIQSNNWFNLIGGGATFAALIVLSTMNLPIEIVALLISVEPLIDMGRTALNVSGSIANGLEN